MKCLLLDDKTISSEGPRRDAGAMIYAAQARATALDGAAAKKQRGAMIFQVGWPSSSERDVCYLRRTSWDDWFKFETLFNLAYVDSAGKTHEIGGTKIGQLGLHPARPTDDRRVGYRRPEIPATFTELPQDHFSLGQDTSFYEALEAIGGHFRDQVLAALRDIAFDPELLSLAEGEEVTKVSLLREVPLLTVRDQFARLARGGAALTPYVFNYKINSKNPLNAQVVRFAVAPNSRPPSNIHVLIGRNGVGKSTLLNNMAKALVRLSKIDGDVETPTKQIASDALPAGLDLSNLVSVSFSAFDAFEPITVPQDRTKGLTYHYIGLKKISPKKDESSTKDLPRLSYEMTSSARSCLQGARRSRWLRAIALLETDPIFADARLSDLIAEDQDEGTFFETLAAVFKRLSSGHKIVLLTVTRLVETVVEKSLVLLDEPEAHLHPPLLSAFVRALSDLLTNRNGMAIIATHSPVVLQEVPRSCVWKLRRNGNVLFAERPPLETFGENVGTLTDDVFGLEVTSTGFHKMLTDAAMQYGDYDQALASFQGQLGAEGRAILRARVAARKSTRRHVES